MTLFSMRTIGLVLLIPVFFAAQVYFNFELRKIDGAFVELPPERTYEVNPEIARFMAFGQVPLVVDWLLIHFLTEDPGLSHVPAGTHPPAFYDLKLATALDPAFAELYTIGASLLSVVRNDGAGAKALLLSGERFRLEELPHYPAEFRQRYWRMSWQVPFFLAYVELFDMNNMKGAADAFIQAAQVPGVLPYIQRLASRLSKPGGHYDVAVGLATAMLRQAVDTGSPTEVLQKRLRSLQIQQFLWQANENWNQYLAQNKIGIREASARFDSLRARAGILGADPVGGKLLLDDQGRIQTQTIFEKALGLE